jgi:hypothetical protein
MWASLGSEEGQDALFAPGYKIIGILCYMAVFSINGAISFFLTPN